MHITHVFIDGFKSLRNFTLELNPRINLLVGDNETGKSTVLESIALALTRVYRGRNVDQSLDSYVFNLNRTNEYIRASRRGENSPPPEVRIEVYFEDDPADVKLSRLKGQNNQMVIDCPGVKLHIEPDNEYTDDLLEYVRDPENPALIPVEYYKVCWRSFADGSVNARSIPVRATTIDTSRAIGARGQNRYVGRVVEDTLSVSQRHQLALEYKRLRYGFQNQPGVVEINDELAKKGDLAPSRRLSVQLDVSSRSTWENAVTAHVDDLPIDCVGKGEQSRVQMRLAVVGATASRVLLVEEPENHLSHSTMNVLMNGILELAEDQQVIITTHSAFVLNKLGVDNLILLSKEGGPAKLDGLSPDTRAYFMKLPGYDTLRLVLADRCILVEGPSDELIVCRAYLMANGRLPIEDGVDVISVRSLAFKRFLEIARLMNLDVRAVVDNDGNVAGLKARYSEYLTSPNSRIQICFDDNEAFCTLEPQLLRANSLRKLSQILGRSFANEDVLLNHMKANKTDCALRFFETEEEWNVPEYIKRAIS